MRNVLFILRRVGCTKTTLLAMKITAFILFVACMQLAAKGKAQTLTIVEKHASLKKLFTEISKQTGYSVLYEDADLKNTKPIDISVHDGSLNQVLEVIFTQQPLIYNIVEKTIIVKPKPAPVLESTVITTPTPIDISGRVTDKDGHPLEGASVLVKGARNGTTTNANGFFILKNVSSDDEIVISYSGYQSITVKVGDKTSFAVSLEVSQNPLDQVQIVAYGQTIQRLSVGNTATVTAKQIEEQPVQSVLMALEGQVPGLIISQATGMPGSGFQVNIQGPNSIRFGNDPLYVVDGVPFVQENLSTTVGTQVGHSGINAGGYGSPLNFINPDDIESISVLKDADATAIYGSQAANGAILITTKKGKAGQTQININLQQGEGRVPHFVNLLNSQQYIAMLLEAYKNDNVAVPSIVTTPNDTHGDINGMWDQSRYTDWQKVLLGGTAHFSNFEGSVSGGTGQTNYLVSGTYNRQTSVFPGNYADQRGAVHLNLNTASINERFRLQFLASYMADDNQLPQVDLTSLALQLPPDAPPLYTTSGALNWDPLPTGAQSWTNPLGGVLYHTYQNQTNNLVSNLVLSYHILPGLDARINGGYINYRYNETSEFGAKVYSPYLFSLLGNNSRTALYSYNSVQSWIAEPQAEYKHQWGKGTLDALVGATARQQNSSGVIFNGTGYTSDALLSDQAAAATLTSSSASQATYKYSAAFSRLNYNYADKYLIEVSGRRDGSSRFGSNNEFHDFWSAGAGWIFSEENLVKNHFHWLSYGKLKGSYGTTGNDQIGDYTYLNIYSVPTQPAVPYQGISILSGGNLPNPNLQWEETYKLQGGIDLGFFNDRIVTSVEYVYNRSSNELYFTPLPSITGFSGLSENLPFDVLNKSWEISLHTINVKTRMFTWSSSANLTIPKYSIGENTLTKAQLGILNPIGNISVYHFAGVDPATGVYQFNKANGQLTSSPTSADQTSFVNPILPSLYGGFSNTFRYGHLSLDVFLQYVKQIRADYFSGPNTPGRDQNNQPVVALNRWQRPGDIATFERFSGNSALFTQWSDFAASTGNFSDAGYLRLKNVSVAYDLANLRLKHVGMKSLRIYLQGENLLTFTHYTGLDPETAPTTGAAGAAVLPPLRMITVGVRAGL